MNVTMSVDGNRRPQIVEQMDNLLSSLEQLESTVGDLAAKLSALSQELPEDKDYKSVGEPRDRLVPLAETIRVRNDKVVEINARLTRIISSLEV
jgi:hypothetical protein